MPQREPRHHNPPEQTDRARELRRDSTIPERILWGMLRGRKIGGLKFRRQETIGSFIVDFVCHERALVVELDGESHVGRFEADEKRTRFLESAGYRVFRVTNDDLLSHQEAVITGIARAAGLDW